MRSIGHSSDHQHDKSSRQQQAQRPVPISIHSRERLLGKAAAPHLKIGSHAADYEHQGRRRGGPRAMPLRRGARLGGRLPAQKIAAAAAMHSTGPGIWVRSVVPTTSATRSRSLSTGHRNPNAQSMWIAAIAARTKNIRVAKRTMTGPAEVQLTNVATVLVRTK